MDQNVLKTIKSMINKNKLLVTKIKEEMKPINRIEDDFCEYQYKKDFLSKYKNRNYYLFKKKEDAIPLEDIEVTFLFENNDSLSKAEPLKFYSFSSIIEACQKLKFKKPLVITEKMGKKEIIKQKLERNYKQNLFSQLYQLNIIKNIYIIDLYENESILKNIFLDKRTHKFKLENEYNDLLLKDFKYNNTKGFYEYYNLCFLDKKEKNEENEFSFTLNSNRKKLFTLLNDFFDGNTYFNILYLLGPMSSGKTTTLIHYKNLYNFPLVYINLKILNNLNGKERLNPFLYETVKFFENYKAQEEFFDKIFSKDNNIEVMKTNDIIIKIIKNLKNIIPNIKIIVDQYKEKYDQDGIMKKELITLFNNDKKSKLLFCSSINDYDERFYVLNKIYDIPVNSKNGDIENIKVEYVDELFSINKIVIETKCSENKKEILEELGFLPRMAFKILILEDHELSNFKKNRKAENK